MAGEHPAPRGARVWGLAHRPPVGTDRGALLPEVSGPTPGSGSSQGMRGWGQREREAEPRKTRHHLAEARGRAQLQRDGGLRPGGGAAVSSCSRHAGRRQYLGTACASGRFV